MKTIIGFFLIAGFISSKVMACPENKICVGDSVIDKNNNIGVVLRIFTNGKIYVDWDNITGHTIFPNRNLAKKIKCYKNFCTNTPIINKKNNIGTILSAFNNGKVYVDWDAIIGHTVTTMSDLGYELEKRHN